MYNQIKEKKFLNKFISSADKYSMNIDFTMS